MDNQKNQPPLTGWQLALDRAPQFLSVILLFCVPFLTQPKGLDPMMAKATAAQALVFLMAGLWALKVYSAGRLTFIASKALALLGFLALWLALDLILSPYPQAALAGFGDLCPFLVWYLLLSSTCTEAWRGENLLVVFLVSGLGTALWALGQSVGWAEGPWLAVSREKFGGRPVAGMGDPDSLAGFLILVWPMALGLMVRASRFPAKGFWGLVVASCLLALFLTGSGAGWAATAAGAAVFALVLLREKSRRMLPWVIGICLFLAACFLLPPLLERMKSIGNNGPGSVQLRQEVWGAALEVIREHPLEGTGPGTFWTAFPSRQPYAFGLREPLPAVSHAGNWILEWTSGTGLIGLLLLLAFWYFVGVQWWRLFAAHAIPPSLAAGFFAALTGAALDGLFNAGKGLSSTLVPLLFLAALPVPLSQRFTRIPGYPLRQAVLDFSAFKPYLLPLLALVSAGCLWQVKGAFERQGADVLLGRAAGLAAGQKWEEALSLCDSALKATASDVRGLELRSGLHLLRNAPGDAQKALADLELLERIAPDHPGLHWRKYRILSLLDRRGEATGELKKAVRAQPALVAESKDYRKALDLTGRKRHEEALGVYMKLVLEYPACVPLMVDYGKGLAAVGRISDARIVLGDALKLHPGNEGALKGLAALGGGAP